MRTTRRHCLFLVLLAPLMAGACSTAGGSTPAPGPSPAPTASPDNMTAAEIEAVYRARTDSLLTVFTPADAAFMAAMIHHHAQAIDISQMAPTHGASASIQTLASRIINAQEGEIGVMQQWLRSRKQAVPEMHVMDGRVMVHAPGEQGHVHMTGMLTPAQVEELNRTRGAEFDRLFLKYMIQHHQGAVTMVRDLFAGGGGIDDSVYKFASDIQADQSSEVARMQRMLDALEGSE